MNKDTKKYLIYLRYVLPIFALAAMLVMLFVPSYRFIFSGKAGELMSNAKLISNSWEQARTVLFGTAEKTDAAIIFSRILLALVIVSVILFFVALAVSIWSVIVAFKCFLSDDEEGAEKSRRTFCAFVPNRIALCAITLLSTLLALVPYLMSPLYDFTYSEPVSLVLEAPDALIIGGALLLCSIILSIICAPIERAFGADIFERKKADIVDDTDDLKENELEDANIDRDTSERIRRLFDKDNDKNKN